MERNLSRVTRREFLQTLGILTGGALLPHEKTRNLELEYPSMVYLIAPQTGLPVFYRPNEKSHFKPAHDILKSAVIAAEILEENKEFVRIHPDNGVQSNFWQEDGFRNVYIRRNDFRELTEFGPLTVFGDTKNPDKLAIIVFNETAPEGVFLEKDKIVAYLPIGLGGQPKNSSTPVGDYHISSVRVTRNMNTLHGVPFPCYFNRTEGKAFHGAPWKDWTKIKKGYFGTAGCINLPSFAEESPYNVSWDSTHMGFDQFFFRWVRTVFPFNVYEQEMMEVNWDEHDYYTGNITLRTLVVEKIEDLFIHSTHPLKMASYTTWDPVISNYLQLKKKNEWVIPQKIGENVQFINIAAG